MSGPRGCRAGAAEQARGLADEAARPAAIEREGRLAHDIPCLAVAEVDVCRHVVVGAGERKRPRARSVEDRPQRVVAAGLTWGRNAVGAAGARAVVIAAVAVHVIPVVALLALRQDAVGAGGEDVRLATVLVGVADDDAVAHQRPACGVVEPEVDGGAWRAQCG